MSKESTVSGEIIQAMSKLLKPFAAKGRLARADKNGIEVWYSKATTGLVMFHFITKDSLEVELEFDFKRLKDEGRDYILGRVELVVTQLEAAREEKQDREAIILLPTKQLSPVEKAIGLATVGNTAPARNEMH